MHALSKLFEALHLTRKGRLSGGHYRRRRQTSRRSSFLSCETLESKQLLAADVAQSFATVELDTTGPVTVAIEGKFQEDTVSGTVVKFDTNAPVSDSDIFIELTSDTPLTNDNFLQYVNNDDYDNTFFHRSVAGFALQGGGFTAPTVDANQQGSDPVSIPTTGTVNNEPGNLNTRGTIAMAKLGGLPDSATSQFFFNLNNNSFLDSDNGGYTVFGEVLGSGMSVVDTMALAPTYDATTYYANSALAELPLYNTFSDNIIRPNDFLKIENADVVTESDLMTYVVESSDTAKLTASFDGNGDLVLTPVGSATGSVDVTVTATSKLDNSTASDVFSVTLGGQAGPTLIPISSDTSGVQLQEDADGNYYAGSLPIKWSDGTQLSANQIAGYSLVGVETVGGINYAALRSNSTKELRLWTLDSDWKRTSLEVIANSTSEYLSAESSLNLDANSDGFYGRPFELTGVDSDSTGIRLNFDNSGRIYAGGLPIKDSQDLHLSLSEYLGYSFVGAEQVGDTNYLAVRLDATNELRLWTMSRNWEKLSSDTFTDGSAEFLAQELSLQLDINRDGVRDGTTAQGTLVETDTYGVRLREGLDNKLYAGNQAIKDDNGQLISKDQYQGFTFVGAETIDEINYVALRYEATSQLRLWEMTNDWQKSNVSFVNNFSVEMFDFESALGLDINADGSRGVTRSNLLLDDSGVRLQVDSLGRLYANSFAIFNSDGQQVTEDEYQGFTFVGAEEVGGINYVAVRYDATMELRLWSMSGSWRKESVSAIGKNSAAYLNFESSLALDLNDDGIRDGTISVSAPLSTDSYGVRLLKDGGSNLFVGSNPVLDESGLQVQSGSYGGFTFIGAETYNGTNYIAIRQDATQELRLWTMSSDWQKQSVSRAGKGSSAFKSYEKSLMLDIDEDGFLDGNSLKSTFLATDTTGIKLNYDASGKLFADSQVVRDSDGRQIKFDDFTGFTFIGAEKVGDTNFLAVRQDSTNELRLWEMSKRWRKLGVSSFADGTSDFFSKEQTLSLDINGDGTKDGTASDKPLVESDSYGVRLTQDDQSRIYAGNTPILDSAGSHLTINAYPGFSILAVETYDETNFVAVRYDANQELRLWTMNENWQKIDVLASSDGTLDYYANEELLGCDLNTDGVVGMPFENILTDTSGVRLRQDAIGRLYANDDPISTETGFHISVSTFTGFTVIGAETVGSTNYVAVRHDITSQLRLWEMDSDWQKATVTSIDDGTTQFTEQEAALKLDIDGDGTRDGSIAPGSLVPTDTYGERLIVDNGGKLFVGSIPLKDSDGSQVSNDSFLGFTIVGAERSGEENYVAVRQDSTNELRLWKMSLDWQKESVSGYDSATEQYYGWEENLRLDINQDGKIGNQAD